MNIKLLFNQFVYCILSLHSKILKDTCSIFNIDIQGTKKKKPPTPELTYQDDYLHVTGQTELFWISAEQYS